MQKLSWLFSFDSKFDGIKKATKALDSMDKSVGRVEKTVKAGTMAKLGAQFKKSLPAMGKAAAGIAQVGLAMAGAAVVGGLALGAVGAKYALDAGIFKDQTLGAFKAFLGSEQAAADMYKQTIDASAKFAVGPKDALEGVKQLLGAGFDAKKAMEIFAGATDLSKLTGGDTKALTTVLGQIQSKGKLQTEELLQLAESGGLAMGKVMEQLGKTKGIDTSTVEGMAQIQKMLEGGKIDSKTGIAAALAAIQQMTGKPLGKYAEEGAKSVGGLLTTLANAPEKFLLQMNNEGAMKPLQGVLSTIVDKINDPKTGGRITAVFERLATLAGKVFNAMAGGDLGGVIDGMVTGFEGVAGALEQAWPYVEAMTSGAMKSLGKVLGPMLDSLAKINDKPPSEDTLKRYERFGAIIGWIGGLLIKAAENLGGSFLWAFNAAVTVVGWLGETVQGLADVVSPIIDAAWDWGADLVSGLWQGIKDGWSWMIGQFEGLVDLLPDAVKTALGIASPSKVFAELGRFSAMGYGVGFTAEAANMNAQVQGAIAMPDPGVVAGAASSSSTSSGNTFSGTIVIQSSGTAGQSTAEQAKELGDQVLDYLRRQWVAA